MLSMGPSDRLVLAQAHATRPPWNAVLRALREARGITQGGWATQLGVSSKTVLRWEAGERVPDRGQKRGSSRTAASTACCARTSTSHSLV
jgi:DNA-binding transcriptional regulator YiaG